MLHVTSRIRRTEQSNSSSILHIIATFLDFVAPLGKHSGNEVFI